MPSIFISYRREESADASGRIADFLERRFGSRAVFRDVNAILAGSNFVKALQRALDDARVMLVLIGPHWIHMREANGWRRIDLPTDFVHYEVATALRTGKLVIPVLIDGASLPTAAELPPDIAALAHAVPVSVRNDPYFADDMVTVVAAIRRMVAWRPASIGVLVAALGGVLGVVYSILRAAHLLALPHDRGLDYLTFVTPPIALLFAIIRAGRTRRWLWLTLMLAAGLMVPLSYLIPGDLGQPLVYYPVLLILLVFGLFGPRRPYRSPDKQRPTHSAIMTTSWIIALALDCELVVYYHPNATSAVDADVAFTIVCAAVLVGDVLALMRAWHTHSWAWGIPLATLFTFSLVVIPLTVFTSVLPTGVGSLLTFLLILAQTAALGVFGWWGPRIAPARPKAPIEVNA